MSTSSSLKMLIFGIWTLLLVVTVNNFRMNNNGLQTHLPMMANPQQHQQGKGRPSSPLRFRLHVYSLANMAIQVELGTPARPFNMSISFDDEYTILLQSKLPYSPFSKADPPYYERNIYAPNMSSTYVDLRKNFSDFLLGTGHFASDLGTFQQQQQDPSRHDNNNNTSNKLPTISRHGAELRDNGGNLLRLPVVLLDNATAFFTYPMEIVPADGRLGLGPRLMAPEGVPSFVAALALARPIVTFHFRPYNANDPDERMQRSEAVVGLGDDLSNLCDHNGWFYTSAQASGTAEWRVRLNSVWLSSRQRTKVELGRHQTARVAPAGEFQTVAPKAQMAKLARLLGASDAEWPGLFQLPCNATETAPNITFEFDGPTTTTIPSTPTAAVVVLRPADYILPSMYGECQLTFRAQPFASVNRWRLGYSFFRRHCVLLDYNTSATAAVGLSPMIGVSL